ncbi:hypothetical protein [Adlercreutzia shanghongiae]|uniref:Uncharacterized protein n=1 Tax=Adlercreutzia shanghongiae TaxID=3111773 RepID=A0ABU6IWX3_9ACTN|nr:hypothetical protein [Adlercreutzia sp. R22]MEC4294342.1 hypothetical protein [Adlercreutzia sp. R22]
MLANNPYIADANDLMAGLKQFGPNSLNTPGTDGYGFIRTYANSTDPSYRYLWRYQVGFSKAVYVRWKINSDGTWSAWLKL